MAFSAFFDPLFRITQVRGGVLAVKPGAEEPEEVVEGRAYPYGTRVLVGKANPKAKEEDMPEAHIILSYDHQFKLGAGGDLVVRHGDGGDENKKVMDLSSGKLRTFITISRLPTGGQVDAEIQAGIDALSVATPLGVVCTRLTERNEISVSSDGRHYTVLFASGGSLMNLAGPQYKVHTIKRNSAVEVFGDRDFTRISSLGGEFTADVERGASEKESVSFKNRSIVKIWRTYAKIGGKMAVSVMVVAPDGSIRSYAFLEGQAAVVDSAIAADAPITGGAEGAEGAGATGEATNGTPVVGDAPAADGGEGAAPADAAAPGGETIDFNFDTL